MSAKTTTPAVVRTAPRGFTPDYAVPPGETLKEAIDALGLTQRDLAERAELTPKTVNLIINGKAPITVETSLRFERVTGVPARLWNELEHRYQERRARLAEHHKFAEDLEWLKTIEIQELVRRRAIAPQKDRSVLLAEVLRFFGVASVEAWRRVWEAHAAVFRKSTRVKSSTGAVAAWVRLAELEALKVSCQPYDAGRFKEVLRKVRKLTNAEWPAAWTRTRGLSATAGVAIVFIPGIRAAPVSGATRWLTAENAMIALSFRHKRDDHFWFSFFHEAGHILLDSKKELFLDGVDKEEDSREREANRFAATFLIPTESDAELRRLKTAAAIVQFARSIEVAPGVVVGRLQRERLIPYNRFNYLKRKVQLGHRGGT